MMKEDRDKEAQSPQNDLTQTTPTNQIALNHLMTSARSIKDFYAISISKILLLK